jgi:hypothetical protein
MRLTSIFNDIRNMPIALGDPPAISIDLAVLPVTLEMLENASPGSIINATAWLPVSEDQLICSVS